MKACLSGNTERPQRFVVTLNMLVCKDPIFVVRFYWQSKSVSKPDNMSHNQTDCPTQSLFVSKSDNCLIIRQSTSCTSCQHMTFVSWALWCFCCLDSFCTLCLEGRQSVSRSDNVSNYLSPCEPYPAHVLCWSQTVCQMHVLHMKLVSGVFYFCCLDSLRTMLVGRALLTCSRAHKTFCRIYNKLIYVQETHIL